MTWDKMELTKNIILRALVGIATPSNDDLDCYVASFNMWAEAFKINTPKRIAMYLAQTLHESNYLKATVENLNYSADGLLKTFPKYFNAETAKDYARNPQKIANKVYANRMGNGNEDSGDGWKYRGRGYIQLTGKENYQKLNSYDICTANVLNDPDSVGKVEKGYSKYYLAQLASMWFWEKNKINDAADNEDVQKATKIINGGINGLSNRQLLYRRFAKEFGIKKV